MFPTKRRQWVSLEPLEVRNVRKRCAGKGCCTAVGVSAINTAQLVRGGPVDRLVSLIFWRRLLLDARHRRNRLARETLKDAYYVASQRIERRARVHHRRPHARHARHGRPWSRALRPLAARA